MADKTVIISSLRISRHIYYSLVVLAGYFAFSYTNEANISLSDILVSLILINVLFFSAMLLNNLFDDKIDIENNKINFFNYPGYQKKNFIILFLSTIPLSLALSYYIAAETFIITLIIHIVSFLYSGPPFRIKRIFLLNTFFIALSGVLAFALGFSAAAKDLFFAEFPYYFGFVMLIVLFMAYNVKDINDYRGDKKYGIKTFMTVFGEKKGKKITAFLALAGYLIFPLFFLNLFLVLPALACGAATYYIIMKKSGKINESAVFGVFFVFAVFVVFSGVFVS